MASPEVPSGDRKVLRFCVVEVFSQSEKDKGVRVIGDDVSVRLLSAISQGCPSACRMADHRGWFCFKYFTVSKILNLFQSHGWEITNMYQMMSHHPFNKIDALADFIIFQKPGFIADDIEKQIQSNEELVDASTVAESKYEGKYDLKKHKKQSFFGKRRSKQEYLTDKRQLSIATSGSGRSLPELDEYELEEIYGPPLFGTSLKYVPQNSYGVPLFVEDVIDFLNTDEHLRQEGLFRISASTLQIQEVKQRLDRGERVIFANIPDINVPANLLKMFLKCLPESLIPISLTDMLAALLEIPDESEKLKYLAWMLENYVPDPNYATLKYIVGFLSNVGIYSQYNKMNAGNLALIFGPNFMWSADDPLGGALGSMKGLNSAIQLMVTHFEKVFETPAEIRKSDDQRVEEVESSDEENEPEVTGSVDLA